MSYITPAPYTLTDAEIASVLSPNTVSAKLTDTGIAAVLSSGTVGAAMAGLAGNAVGQTLFGRVAGVTLVVGDTIAGSSLLIAGVGGDGSNNATTLNLGSSQPAGTWKALGYVTSATIKGLTLFQRIS